MKSDDVKNSNIDKTLDQLNLDDMYQINQSDIDVFKQSELKKKKLML